MHNLELPHFQKQDSMKKNIKCPYCQSILSKKQSKKKKCVYCGLRLYNKAPHKNKNQPDSEDEMPFVEDFE